MLVKNWMSAPPITIDMNDSMQDAINLIRENSINMLPVINKQRLVGVVTDGDLKRASASDATTLEIHELLYLITKIKIKDIMTKDPITVLPDFSVEETAEVLLKNRISGVPVVKNRKLVGILTNRDLRFEPDAPQERARETADERVAGCERRPEVTPPAPGANMPPMHPLTTTDIKRPTAATVMSLKVTVSLSPAVAKKAAPEDVVFIFARAASGPRLPLAIGRTQDKDLRSTVVLDDSQVCTRYKRRVVRRKKDSHRGDKQYRFAVQGFTSRRRCLGVTPAPCGSSVR